VAGLYLPDSFLGGSAPRLQTLYSRGISFPALPKLLSSASNLVELRPLGYSPFWVHFTRGDGHWSLRINQARTSFHWIPIPRPRSDQPSPPPSIRAVLPALNYLYFRGVSEYLEDLTSRIDAPLLNRNLDKNKQTEFFIQLIFNTPRLCSFISRAERLRSQSQAQLTFSADLVNFPSQDSWSPRVQLDDPMQAHQMGRFLL
jgi:hypothetical protein